MKQSSGFDRNDYPLKKFRHEVWKGFVLVNFDGQAESLASQYAALDPIVDVYDLENYQTVEQTDWGVCDWDWDWKIMVDNFMECYHHMGPHRGSLEDRFPASMSYTGEVGDYFTTMWSQQVAGYPSDPPFLSPGADTLTAQHKDKSLIFIAYPLLQIAMGPHTCTGSRHCRSGRQDRTPARHLHVPASLAAPNVEERRSELVKTICDIHREDLDVCAAVQRAIRSGLAAPAGCRTSSGRSGSSTATLGANSESSPHKHSRIDRMTQHMTTTLNGQTATVASAAREVADQLAAKGVKYAAISFVDMHGKPKSKMVPLGHLTQAALGSEMFTGAALDGVPRT